MVRFMSRMAVVGCFALALPTPALAQGIQSFADLVFKLKPGQTVDVVDGSQAEFRGELKAISASELLVDIDGSPHRFTVEKVQAVGVYGHRVGYIRPAIGGALGLASGLVAGAIVSGLLCEGGGCASNSGPGLPLFGTLVGAGIGAWIDVSHGSTRWVYDAPRMKITVVPVFLPAQRTLTLKFSF